MIAASALMATQRTQKVNVSKEVSAWKKAGMRIATVTASAFLRMDSQSAFAMKDLRTTDLLIAPGAQTHFLPTLTSVKSCKGNTPSSKRTTNAASCLTRCQTGCLSKLRQPSPRKRETHRLLSKLFMSAKAWLTGRDATL